MSTTFSTNAGSLESRNVLRRCGLTPNRLNHRWMLERDTPGTCLSIARIDQCVAPSGGGVSKAALMTSATFASSWVRGRPDFGASSRPAIRYSRKALTPVADGLLADPEAGRDLAMGVVVGEREDDPGTAHEAVGLGTRARQGFERGALVVGEEDWFGRAAGASHVCS